MMIVVLEHAYIELPGVSVTVGRDKREDKRADKREDKRADTHPYRLNFFILIHISIYFDTYSSLLCLLASSFVWLWGIKRPMRHITVTVFVFFDLASYLL